MDEHTHNSEGLEVWLDGACPVCRKSQRFCERRLPGGRVRFEDFRIAKDSDLPMERRAHEASMWIRDSDGRMLEGFPAWRRIMAEIPGWRWLATLAGLPPARWIGPTLYRFIARSRFGLPFN